MGNIFGIFQTGVSGIYAAQAGIDVTGHNISNVNTPGFSRQRVNLTTDVPNIVSPGPFGRGVQVEQIARIADDVLNNAVNKETSNLTYWEGVQTNLSRVEVYFNELEQGSGLGDSLKEYFDSWSDLSNSAPDNSDEANIKRYALVENAVTLAGRITDSYSAMEDLRSESDTKIQKFVTEVNDISENIAFLNGQIAKVEVSGDVANDFRDQRDQLVHRLSELADTQTYERANGQIAVFVAGEAMVDEGTINEFAIEVNPDNGRHYDVVWKTVGQQNQTVNITDQFSGGMIYAELYSRDHVVKDYIEQIDTLATTLINETNRLHATGQGLERVSQMTSTNGVANAQYLLSETPGALPHELNKGTFRITVYDEEGNVHDSYDIDIDPEEDSMASIAQRISEADSNASSGVIQAYISQGNTVRVNVAEGYTFAFEADTSGFLVAAGFGGFFKGASAEDIDVSDLVRNNPKFVATGASGTPGDNSKAREIADLKFASVFSESTVTMDEFYSFFVGQIGSDKYQVDLYVETKQMAVTQLEMKQEEIRGVSMDEEMTNLMKFQRAYEASARFINTVDQMIDRLINGMGV